MRFLLGLLLGAALGLGLTTYIGSQQADEADEASGF